MNGAIKYDEVLEYPISKGLKIIKYASELSEKLKNTK
jgi:hypothetical protein